MVEIPPDHMSPQCNATQCNPNLYLDYSFIEKGDANQLEAMCHTPQTVLLPPGWDCVAVYFKGQSDIDRI